MGVRKRRIPWGWIGILVVSLAGGAFAVWQQRTAAARASEIPKGVQIGRAERGNLDQKVSATGVVAAQTGAKVNIGSQITGRIRRLPADVGTHVRVNQVVAELDVPDLQAQVEQQTQNVAVARANLEQARSRLSQAELNVNLSRDQTDAQILEAEFAIKAAQARLEMSQATARMQPTQTSSEIARAEAALSTALSSERQVKQTVNLQRLQAQSSIDDARASLENFKRLRTRQETLLARGYISRQEVEDTRTQLQQAQARFQSAQASLDIVKEKTQADLLNAHDLVLQAQATREAARAGKEQDVVREAEVRNTREAIRQAEATLALRRASRTQDRIRKQALEEARGSLRQSQAALRQSEAQLRYQQAQLAKAVIHSPIDGTVLSVTTQQGETVTAGFQTQTLITVADLNRLEVKAYVDETDIGRVRAGLPAEVRVESYQDRTFHGRVARIAAASTIKDNVVTYETTVAITDAGGLLRPDMTADVTLILGRRADVLLVPAEAVHREINRALVYVLHRNKQGKERVETREVRLGSSDGTQTEIVSGLKEGEEVILAGLPRFGIQATDAQTTDPNKNRKQ